MPEGDCPQRCIVGDYEINHPCFCWGCIDSDIPCRRDSIYCSILFPLNRSSSQNYFTIPHRSGREFAFSVFKATHQLCAQPRSPFSLRRNLDTGLGSYIRSSLNAEDLKAKRVSSYP